MEPNQRKSQLFENPTETVRNRNTNKVSTYRKTRSIKEVLIRFLKPLFCLSSSENMFEADSASGEQILKI